MSEKISELAVNKALRGLIALIPEKREAIKAE